MALAAMERIINKKIKIKKYSEKLLRKIYGNGLIK